MLFFYSLDNNLTHRKTQIGRINLDAQLDNFANNKQDIIATIGVPATQKLLETAFFSITIGANDFINNYLVPIVSKIEQKFISPETFVAAMVSRFRIQLTVSAAIFKPTKQTESNQECSSKDSFFF